MSIKSKISRNKITDISYEDDIALISKNTEEAKIVTETRRTM